jgi:hypothetical protein
MASTDTHEIPENRNYFVQNTCLERQVERLQRDLELSNRSLTTLKDLNRGLGVMVSKLAIAFDQQGDTMATQRSASGISSLVVDLQRCQRDVADLRQISMHQQQIITSQEYHIEMQTQRIAELRDFIHQHSQSESEPNQRLRFRDDQSV